ncbi:GAF domain-containing protein [Halobacteriovorax sp. ZH4_bin.1]|uniref:GAF domain-containing protein n=1 Tax=unclassified Halobacteriovorax TaxID=2639665 RepID=UPI00371D17C4
MITAKETKNEKERLSLLESLKILDTEDEDVFDNVTQLASEITNTPTALLSFVDKERQWFKSKVGADICETQRELSFCAHAIHSSEPLIVEDARVDDRFKGNPLVCDGPKIVFYAGFPLEILDGHRLGTLCIIDTKPRSLDESQISMLKTLANQICQLLRLRSDLNNVSKFSLMMEEIQRLNLASTGDPFDFFPIFLSRGVDVLDLEYGIISHINDGIYHVVEVVGPDNQIEKGFEASITDTYCDLVIKKNKTIVFENVGEDEQMCAHPVYVNMKLESFIGTPIRVNNEIYGTLNYSSRIIKKRGFSKEEVRFVEILSQLISKKIEVWNALKEREKAFSELQESLNEFQTLSELLPVGVFLTTEDGLARYQNRRWLEYAGMTKEEALGEGWIKAIYAEQRQEVGKKWAQAAANSKEFDLDIKFCNVKTGEITFTKTIATPLRNNDGQVYGHIGVNLDTTKQLEYEKSLRDATKSAQEASKAKSLFLANMSHEIRTPLNSIVGFSDLLSKADISNEYVEYASSLKSSSEVLLNLVNDILDISKIEASAISLDKRTFNLKDLLIEVMDIFTWPAKKKNISLSYSIEESLAHFFIGDSSRIMQILINLISNAIKFTDEGSILVKVQENTSADLPGNLIINVIDSGIGIPEDVKDNIFKAFDQGKKSTTREHGGTGLGLAITKELVELMGGSIHVKSREGIGSEFVISLALEVEKNQQAPFVQNEGPNKEEKLDASELKILLVDDAINNRNLIKVYLKNENATIIEAENGQEAFDLYKKENNFDIILMDLQMPIMDGFEAIEKIRDLERSENISRASIIALTAYALKEDKERCFEIGCDEYLIKPVKKDGVIKLINKVLASKGE